MIETSGPVIVAGGLPVRPSRCRRSVAGTRSLLVSLIASTALMASPLAAAPSQGDAISAPETMIFDGLVVRPLGLVATVVGAAAWVVTLPFSLLGRNAMDAGKVMVVEPAAFTFARPLGDL